MSSPAPRLPSDRLGRPRTPRSLITQGCTVPLQKSGMVLSPAVTTDSAGPDTHPQTLGSHNNPGTGGLVRGGRRDRQLPLVTAVEQPTATRVRLSPVRRRMTSATSSTQAPGHPGTGIGDHRVMGHVVTDRLEVRGVLGCHRFPLAASASQLVGPRGTFASQERSGRGCRGEQGDGTGRDHTRVGVGTPASRSRPGESRALPATGHSLAHVPGGGVRPGGAAALSKCC